MYGDRNRVKAYMERLVNAAWYRQKAFGRWSFRMGSGMHGKMAGGNKLGKDSYASKNKITNDNIDNTLIHLIVAGGRPVSRTDLAAMTGLSKMTISKHVAGLIQKGILAEQSSQAVSDQKLGRHPVPLVLSNQAPCIFSILIKRGYLQAILADMSCNIINTHKCYFRESLTKEELISMILEQYDELTQNTKRRILGCGIASLGPVDVTSGCILNPADFYGISDVPVVEILKSHSGLPTCLIHDANAGALVESLYGNGKKHKNFVYLHIEEGIGLGYVINGQLIHTLSGKSGNIGHVSVNINGPKCSCGNVGCLELYASLGQMQKKIGQLLPVFPQSRFAKVKEYTWNTIIDFAVMQDPVAVAALDEFCTYLAHALYNVLNLLDFTTVIIGYDSQTNSDIIEKILKVKFRNFYRSSNHNIEILHSRFNGNAPLLGAAAVIVKEWM